VIPGEMCGRQLRERDPEEEDGPGAWGRAVSEGAGGGRGAPTSGVPASVREGGGTATRPWRGGAGTGRARSAGPWRFAGWGDLGAGRAGLRVDRGECGSWAAGWVSWVGPRGVLGWVLVVGLGLGFSWVLGFLSFFLFYSKPNSNKV
jgi:hypothetical protein